MGTPAPGAPEASDRNPHIRQEGEHGCPAIELSQSAPRHVAASRAAATPARGDLLEVLRRPGAVEPTMTSRGCGGKGGRRAREGVDQTGKAAAV